MNVPADRRAASPLIRALARWQHTAGRYWIYVCSAPFVGDPIPIEHPPIGRPPRWLAEAIGAIPGDERAAVFVDLPPTRTLPATGDLNLLGFAVVPVIQRWITAPAVLRSDRLVACLERFGAVVRRPRPDRGVVFLLDGERGGPPRLRDSTAPARTFDNRYQYPPCRFPPPALLRDDAVTGVWWLAPNGVEEDLAGYASGLEAAGLPIHQLAVPANPGHARADR